MSTSVRLGRPKGQTLTPQIIVQSAIACLETEGIAALGVNRVAKQLGVQPPAIYKHLDGNAGLHRAVRLEGWRQFIAAYCVETQPCPTPEARLREAAYQFRQFAHQHQELYALIMSEPLDLSDPELQGIYQALEAFYQRALAPLGSSRETMIDASRFFHAAIHGFVSAERARLFADARSCDESFEYLVTGLIKGLHSRSNRSS